MCKGLKLVKYELNQAEFDALDTVLQAEYDLVAGSSPDLYRMDLEQDRENELLGIAWIKTQDSASVQFVKTRHVPSEIPIPEGSTLDEQVDLLSTYTNKWIMTISAGESSSVRSVTVQGADWAELQVAIASQLGAANP